MLTDCYFTCQLSFHQTCWWYFRFGCTTRSPASVVSLIRASQWVAHSSFPARSNMDRVSIHPCGFAHPHSLQRVDAFRDGGIEQCPIPDGFSDSPNNATLRRSNDRRFMRYLALHGMCTAIWVRIILRSNDRIDTYYIRCKRMSLGRKNGCQAFQPIFDA